MADSFDLEARLAEVERPGRHERGGGVLLRSRARLSPSLGRLVSREAAVRRATRAGERQWEESKAARKKALRWMAMMLQSDVRDTEVQRQAREAVIDLSVRKVLLARVWEATRPWPSHGAEDFDWARKDGRGLIITGVHFPLGMLGVFRLTEGGGRAYMVRRPPQAGRTGAGALAMRRFFETCEKRGVRWVDRDGAYPVMRELLRRGEICVMNFDAAGHVETMLAGQRTWLAGGMAALALETGAPILPGATVREGIQQVGYQTPSLEPAEFADALALHHRIAEDLSPLILERLPQFYPHRFPSQPRGSWKELG